MDWSLLQMAKIAREQSQAALFHPLCVLPLQLSCSDLLFVSCKYIGTATETRRSDALDCSESGFFQMSKHGGAIILAVCVHQADNCIILPPKKSALCGKSARGSSLWIYVSSIAQPPSYKHLLQRGRFTPKVFKGFVVPLKTLSKPWVHPKGI